MKNTALAVALLFAPLAACATQTSHTPETSSPAAATQRVCGTLWLSTSGGGMPSPDPGWRPAPAGEYPLPGTTVLLLRLSDATHAPGPEVARTTTGPDGTFCFEAAAGAYAVVVTKASARDLMTEEREGFRALARTDITVGSDDLSGVALRIHQFLPQ